MKRVVITGGASGLGMAMAKQYASQGWAVCIADIQDDAGQKLATQLKQKTGAACFFQHLDVTNEQQWLDLQNTVATRWPVAGFSRGQRTGHPYISTTLSTTGPVGS